MPFADYLISILTPLLKEPGTLHVETTNDQMGVLLSVQIHSTDMGQVIGKEGETAKAVRTLMRVYGGHHQARVAVKFLEPDGGRYQKPITT